MKRIALIAVVFLCFAVSVCFAAGKGAGKAIGRQMKEFKREQKSENREYKARQKAERHAHKMRQKSENKEFHESLKAMPPEQKKEAVAAHREARQVENKTFREEQKAEREAEIEKVKGAEQAAQ